MKLRHLIALLSAMIPLGCFSQAEGNDSISYGQSTPEDISLERFMQTDSISATEGEASYHVAYALAVEPFIPYRLAKPLNLHIPDFRFTPGQASLFNWERGGVVASGGTRAFPGLMQIDSGALGVYQSVGNLSFYAGGMVNKYGYFNGLHTQYGLSGNVTYQFSPRLSATVFGDYYFGQPPRMSNGMPMPPAMIGYYGRSTFGGYIDYRINERWGVQTGVQTVQQVGTNRHEVEPIVTPYYRVSKKVAIGLPVGQILYHLLRK